ncbi:hypothetical protein A1O7_02320 [Cladophialophora yegresii CBS 114405]|uniref:Uncharacterized protein n=1 Tax=Cladophialophora yegresii CBS 114405 TaxID=1182544 RepID=W9WUD2_9EURO|nr:uncharacterized protein A1O7_02320 [Cladophialophora yegresii CBS 114405]EXJ61889.1 hypothetical protein A1O7_02320 [Cladophialophora yegresii CBS 114405]
MSFHQLRRSALPVLTALIGSGAVIIGVWSFISPASAANAFGGYMVRILQAQAQSSSTYEDTQVSNNSPSSFAYVYPHGVRNFAQRCLGVVITVGALTPVVDAWVNYRIAPEGVEGDLDRNAARVHTLRTGIWLLGGLWCLLE